MEGKDLYTVEQAMDALGGISRNTIYNLMREGKLASVQIGRRRFIPTRAIEDFIAASMTTKSPSLAGARSGRPTQLPLMLGPAGSPRR
jgi:excisionase family DNA binding protein